MRSRFKMTRGVVAGLMAALFVLFSVTTLSAQAYQVSGLNIAPGQTGACSTSPGSVPAGT